MSIPRRTAAAVVCVVLCDAKGHQKADNFTRVEVVRRRRPQMASLLPTDVACGDLRAVKPASYGRSDAPIFD